MYNLIEGLVNLLTMLRNNLKATVLNISHNGHFLKDDNTKLEWGVKLQQENIEDKIKEWTLIDSKILPYPIQTIILEVYLIPIRRY